MNLPTEAEERANAYYLLRKSVQVDLIRVLNDDKPYEVVLEHLKRWHRAVAREKLAIKKAKEKS